ncbi:MAG TPA: CPBP family intramembrane glutamic endopeptidase [Candidatus Angelobacter sp.]|nr:CPBP family intramembrane glutamic endopeptidase [Candidatus Angelobacter sp.]
MSTAENPIVSRPDPMNRMFYNDRGLRAGWRFLIFVLLFLGLVKIIGSLVLGPVFARSRLHNTDFSRSAAMLVFEGMQFLIIVLATWIMSRIEHRELGAYGLPRRRSAIPNFVSGYLFWGFLPLTLLLGILRVLGAFNFGTINPLNSAMLSWCLFWGVFFLLVGLAEEFLMRGYPLFTLADGLGFWPAAVIMALLFARAHMGNSGETRIGIIATGVFAMFAAATLWRTGDLWLAVGAHAGWDWGQSFFYGVPDSGLVVPGHLFSPTLSTTAPAWLSGGTVGPEGSVLTLVLWGVMFAGFLVIYPSRRNQLAQPDKVQPITAFRDPQS